MKLTLMEKIIIAILIISIVGSLVFVALMQ